MFGAGLDDFLKSETGYKRMDNGMGVNANNSDMKK